ncbi:MAG: mitofilin family membrane protein [Aquisalinus sp.]|nr:mitofilin family membrane protein [Aquisalinus sp.]
MSNSDTPKRDEDNNSDNKPEEVEAEIVEADEAKSDDDVTRLEAETVTEETDTQGANEASSDDDDKAPQSFATTGVIMLGVMALALIVFFLTQGGEDSSGSQVAATGQSEELLSTPVPEQETAVADMAAADEPGNDVLEDEADIAAIAEEVKAEVSGIVTDMAVKVEDTATDLVEQAGDTLESTVEAVEDLAEDTVEAVNDTAAEITADGVVALESVSENVEVAEDNRQAAIERNRARREARAARNQDESASEPEATSPDEPASATEQTAQRRQGNNSETDSAAGSEVVSGEEATTETVASADENKIGNNIVEEVKAQAVENETVVSEAQLADKLESIREDVLAETQAAMAADKQRIAEQDDEIDRLRQEMDEALAEQERRAQQLEARLDTLQTRDVATATKQAALSIAVTNLQRQIGSGRPFAEQLNVLEQLAPATPGLRELAPYAEEGLPTLTGLRLRFADDARKALAAANREAASGFWGEIGARFSGLFSVRKTGLVSGDSPSAIISRAEVSLDDGDVAGALRELDALQGEAADTMAGWMEEARSLVSADTLLDEVSNRVLETL